MYQKTCNVDISPEQFMLTYSNHADGVLVGKAFLNNLSHLPHWLLFGVDAKEPTCLLVLVSVHHCDDTENIECVVATHVLVFVVFPVTEST